MKKNWLLLIITICLALVTCSTYMTRKSYNVKGAMFIDGEFQNVYPTKDKSFSDFRKWRAERKSKDIPGVDSYNFPLKENDPDFLRSNREQSTFTWVGHATALVQINGINILTDPLFSDRASPVQWAGPERVVRPGLELDALPEIDIVVISHDHYDALDKKSIKALADREGGENTLFAVPLGLGDWLSNWGARKVKEFDWWQSHNEAGAEITAVPARHWSKRFIFSKNTTLWAGWVIKAGERKFYFAGDSGYSPIFKEIGHKLGPMDISAIPVGAYEPRWFMKDNHLNPEEAVQVHQDVLSSRSFGIHWGTFILTDEPLDEPPLKLKDALSKTDVLEEDFIVLRHGETVVID